MSSELNQSRKDIFKLIEQFNALNIRETIDWEKYNYYSLVHHLTSIEGASLMEEETQLLLDGNLGQR